MLYKPASFRITSKSNDSEKWRPSREHTIKTLTYWLFQISITDGKVIETDSTWWFELDWVLYQLVYLLILFNHIIWWILGNSGERIITKTVAVGDNLYDFKALRAFRTQLLQGSGILFLVRFKSFVRRIWNKRDQKCYPTLVVSYRQWVISKPHNDLFHWENWGYPLSHLTSYQPLYKHPTTPLQAPRPLWSPSLGE